MVNLCIHVQCFPSGLLVNKGTKPKQGLVSTSPPKHGLFPVSLAADPEKWPLFVGPGLRSLGTATLHPRECGKQREAAAGHRSERSFVGGSVGVWWSSRNFLG